MSRANVHKQAGPVKKSEEILFGNMRVALQLLNTEKSNAHARPSSQVWEILHPYWPMILDVARNKHNEYRTLYMKNFNASLRFHELFYAQNFHLNAAPFLKAVFDVFELYIKGGAKYQPGDEFATEQIFLCILTSLSEKKDIQFESLLDFETYKRNVKEKNSSFEGVENIIHTLMTVLDAKINNFSRALIFSDIITGFEALKPIFTDDITSDWIDYQLLQQTVATLKDVLADKKKRSEFEGVNVDALFKVPDQESSRVKASTKPSSDYPGTQLAMPPAKKSYSDLSYETWLTAIASRILIIRSTTCTNAQYQEAQAWYNDAIVFFNNCHTFYQPIYDDFHRYDFNIVNGTMSVLDNHADIDAAKISYSIFRVVLDSLHHFIYDQPHTFLENYFTLKAIKLIFSESKEYVEFLASDKDCKFHGIIDTPYSSFFLEPHQSDQNLVLKYFEYRNELEKLLTATYLKKSVEQLKETHQYILNNSIAFKVRGFSRLNQRVFIELRDLLSNLHVCWVQNPMGENPTGMHIIAYPANSAILRSKLSAIEEDMVSLAETCDIKERRRPGSYEQAVMTYDPKTPARSSLPSTSAGAAVAWPSLFEIYSSQPPPLMDVWHQGTKRVNTI